MRCETVLTKIVVGIRLVVVVKPARIPQCIRRHDDVWKGVELIVRVWSDFEVW